MGAEKEMVAHRNFELNAERMFEIGCSVAMQSFTFYIDDDRSAFPMRLQVQLPDGAAVRERAEAFLGGSEHYRGIEVFMAATPLFRIGACDSILRKKV